MSDAAPPPSRPGIDASATFIAVADDCPATRGEVPAARKGTKTAATVHHEMACEAPYRYTQSQILFAAELAKKGLDPAEHPEGGATWQAFYAKGQPCLRCSPLGKRYGWGLHLDAQGRVAGYPVDSAEYRRLSADASLTRTRAMRNRRA